MPITFPLALPTNKGLSRIVLRAVTTVGISRSPFSGQQQVYQWPGEWWEADCTLPQMVRSDAEQWLSILAALRGASGTFLLGDPAAPVPLGSPHGTPVVNGASQTGTTLATSGWQASTNNLLLPGDYIQLGPSLSVPSQRLYKVLTVVDSDSSGNATLDIFPRLRESPGNDDPLITTSAQGTFRLAANTVQWDIDAAKTYAISFKGIEAF